MVEPQPDAQNQQDQWSKETLFYAVVLARSVKWAYNRLTARPTVNTTTHDGGVFAEYWASTNVLVLALWQLNSHLRALKDLNNDWVHDVLRIGQEYLDAVDAGDLKNLRDVMQHTDEYVAGRGRKPYLAPDTFEKWASGHAGDDFEMTYLGTSYHLGKLINFALMLEPYLYSQYETYYRVR